MVDNNVRARATPIAADQVQQSFIDRLAAESRRTRAALEDLERRLTGIEGRPEQAEAYREFFALLNILADRAEAIARDIGRFAESVTKPDSGL